MMTLCYDRVTCSWKHCLGTRLEERVARCATPDRLKHFYGKEQDLRVRYVRELKALDHDRARDDEYALEFLEEKK